MKSRGHGKYHHGDLDVALVAAAVAIAEEKGIAAVTTRAIARRLGVSHAAPGRHFPTRGDLVAAVATEAFDRFSRALSDAADRARTKSAKLAAMGHAYVRFGLDHPALLRLMFSPEIAELDPRPLPLIEAGDRAYNVLFESVEGLMSGASDQTLDAGAFYAWSLLHGMTTLWLDGPLRARLSPRELFALADVAIETATKSVTTIRA